MKGPYVTRMMRAARKFDDERDAMLSELGELSEAIAAGTSSAKAKKRAKVLQVSLNIYLPIEDITERSDWLTRAEEQLVKLKGLRSKMEKTSRPRCIAPRRRTT